MVIPVPTKFPEQVSMDPLRKAALVAGGFNRVQSLLVTVMAGSHQQAYSEVGDRRASWGGVPT